MFPLHEVPRTGKSMETESRLVAAGVGTGCRGRRMTAGGTGFVLGARNCPRVEGGEPFPPV